jgi:hypothetical protein
MVERSTVESFIDGYRTAFARFDAEAVAGFFAFPCQVTSDAAEVSVTSVPTREAWLPQIERIIGAYRVLGVSTAAVLDLRVTDLTPRLAQAAVRWGLRNRNGDAVYEFDASYALADLGEGFRITAIAHNETPRLRAALAALQAG